MKGNIGKFVFCAIGFGVGVFMANIMSFSFFNPNPLPRGVEGLILGGGIGLALLLHGKIYPKN